MEPLPEPDIIPLIRNICNALKPYSALHQTKISFSTTIRSFSFSHEPCEIISSFANLICSILSYLPPGNTISVAASVIHHSQDSLFQLSIHNSGINLSRVPAVLNNCKLPVTIKPSNSNATTFLVQLPILLESEKTVEAAPEIVNKKTFPLYYTLLHNKLQTYIAKGRVKESPFLKKVNECILQNLGNELFDSRELSKNMAVSRTQLFRKLKSLAGQSTASYIKTIRLVKAKDLLATTEMTVSEAAYATGFSTVNHFTRVFRKKYGICPSVFRKTKTLKQMDK